MRDEIEDLLREFTVRLTAIIRERTLAIIREGGRRGGPGLAKTTTVLPRRKGRPPGTRNLGPRQSRDAYGQREDEITVPQAARALGLRDQTVRDWIKRHGIPVRATKHGGRKRLLIPRAAVAARQNGS